jgi:hypothetical protein
MPSAHLLSGWSSPLPGDDIDALRTAELAKNPAPLQLIACLESHLHEALTALISIYMPAPGYPQAKLLGLWQHWQTPSLQDSPIMQLTRLLSGIPHGRLSCAVGSWIDKPAVTPWQLGCHLQNHTLGPRGRVPQMVIKVFWECDRLQDLLALSQTQSHRLCVGSKLIEDIAAIYRQQNQAAPLVLLAVRHSCENPAGIALSHSSPPILGVNFAWFRPDAVQGAKCLRLAQADSVQVRSQGPPHISLIPA